MNSKLNQETANAILKFLWKEPVSLPAERMDYVTDYINSLVVEDEERCWMTKYHYNRLMNRETDNEITIRKIEEYKNYVKGLKQYIANIHSVCDRIIRWLDQKEDKYA